MTCNTFNNPSSKKSDFALTTDQLRSQIITFDKLIERESNPAAKYDFNTLVEAAAGTSNLWIDYTTPSNASADGTLTKEAEYPYVSSRVDQGPILPTEFADFLDSSGYDLGSVIKLVTGVVSPINRNDYFSQLDFYYNKNFANSATGGFCSLFTGKLLGLVGLISAGANLLNQLKNGIASFISQLGSIKDLLTGLVDKIKDAMLKQITNIVNQIKSVAQQVAGIGSYFYQKAQQVKDFFSDLNMKSIKENIESLIAGMAGGYEELTPEIIAYLLFRLCQFAETITNFMKSPVDAFKGLAANFFAQQATLTSFSNFYRDRAVQAGGYRMDPIEAARLKTESAKSINEASSGTGVQPTYYVTKATPTPDEVNTISTLTSSGNQYVKFGSQVINQNDPIPEAGWKKVEHDVWVRFFRVAKRMGTTFTINSGYRSPAYNAKQKGAAKNSFHMSGMALDVSMSGISEARIAEFIKYASQEGFGGIGYYGSFVHVDIGPRRTWNTGRSSSLTSEAIRIHLQDGFRRGSAPGTTSPNTGQ